jgi:RNA polymerase sigma factor (sigma-70 family)
MHSSDMTDPGLTRWFEQQVIPCESRLLGYVRRRFRLARQDLDDLRQDVYLKILENAVRGLLPSSASPYLFAVARNLLIDRLRRAEIVRLDQLPDFELMNLLVDYRTPERLVADRQELQHLVEAIQRLPKRCCQVVLMRKIKGMSQKEIARQLDISEGTVENHLARGVRKLASFLRANSERASPADGVQTPRRPK